MSVKKLIKAAIPNGALNAWRSARCEIDYRRRQSLPPERIPRELERWFKRTTGETLDLENPRTFNQKIQWLKLYGPLEKMGELADKYLVRRWVADCIGEECLVPLLGVWDSPDDIDFDGLPNSFALKATHGCGWNIIVPDKQVFDVRHSQRELRRWLGKNFAYCTGGFERHYSFCTPRIVAEAYLDGFADGSLVDYKVHVFNAGEPIVLVCRDRVGNGLPRKAYYDAGWNRLPLLEGDSEPFDCPRPSHLKYMLDFSARLAEGFALVRVDWYEVGGRLYFGEMTFTPANGTKDFRPPEWNEEFGRRIDLTNLAKQKGRGGNGFGGNHSDMR